ncbi:MAG: (5-formylfuran-3-yl)methyl phosphate synthase [Pseudomonadota bacterium]|nr:(5-formylfuran-3-yl)methyl phosphate synthase [Pseudomonadota bacterium]
MTAAAAATSPAVGPRKMRMLVSVRSVEEALAAAEGGADFIDLKEPRDGALGGLPLATIRDVVSALRQCGVTLPISATIGDLPMDDVAQILRRVEAVGACGVDYVKVGIERDAAAASVIDALAGCGWPVVPVFIADHGLDDALVARACASRSSAGPAFLAIMVDTADKRAGSLFDVMTTEALQRFIATVRSSNAMVGLAGALRAMHVDQLAGLHPDFAGFRSAVCVGDRASRLDMERVLELAALVRTPPPMPV